MRWLPIRRSAGRLAEHLFRANRVEGGLFSRMCAFAFLGDFLIALVHLFQGGDIAILALAKQIGLELLGRLGLSGDLWRTGFQAFAVGLDGRSRRVLAEVLDIG